MLTEPLYQERAAALQPARWPLAVRVVAVRLVFDGAELASPSRPGLRQLLLFESFGLNTVGGFARGEISEFVCFDASLSRSHASVPRLPTWVDCVHAELGAAGLLSSILADQQRPAFLLVPPSHFVAVGFGGVYLPGGFDHARVVLGVLLCPVPGLVEARN